MIDTIKLTLEEGMFLITDVLKFQPNAETVLKNLFKGQIVKSVQNQSREDTQNKIYKPKLTLVRRFTKPVFLTMEFSIPKLMFGNNFEEVDGRDFNAVILKLQNILKEMGVDVTEEHLRWAKVNKVDYGKNFILTGISTSATLINLIAKADTTFRTDISKKFYKNGGQLVSFYTKVQEVVFYDKMKDLQRSLNISKDRSEEVDAELQRQFLSTYGRHDILRMEVRIRDYKKLKRVITKEMGKDISKNLKEAIADEQETIKFHHVFNDSIAKKILTNYLRDLKKMLYTVIASHKDGLLQFFISQGVKHKQAFVYTKAMELIKECGHRMFRNMFPAIHRQVDNMMESDIGIILKTENHNSQFLTNAFNRLEDVLYNFKPIRLENGANIQGGAELTDKYSYEFLPEKEDSKYKKMQIKVKPKDKTENDEEDEDFLDNEEEETKI